MPDDLLMTHLADELGFLEVELYCGWNSLVFKEQVAFRMRCARKITFIKAAYAKP
jgi:hypothetical protein